MQLDFIDDEVHLKLPLKYLKNRKSEGLYLELFEAADLASHELILNQHIHEITGILDRRDVTIEAKITKLYRRVFDTNYKDKVKIITHTLASDTAMLNAYYTHFGKITSREKIKSSSTRFEGRSARSVQIGRLLRAANIFLCPIVVIQSYGFFWNIGIVLGGQSFLRIFLELLYFLSQGALAR